MVTDVEDIVDFLGGEYIGENKRITGIESFDDAEENQLTYLKTGYLNNPEEEIIESSAGAVVCPDELSIRQRGGSVVIPSSTPRRDFILASGEFFSRETRETVIHPTAVIEHGATIGDGCVIGPNVYIGDSVTVEEQCEIHAGTSIGRVGMGHVRDDDGRLVNQIHKGDVVIESDVTLGGNCVIDRAVFETTRVGAGTKIHNLTHIAHNVEIGCDTWITQLCSFAGSVSIGERVDIHPGAAIGRKVNIGDDVEIGTNSTVLENVESGATVVGSPARRVD